ncbi:MAG: hypothetical protein K0R63_46 [Rickettsiales bacterium]|jgi:CBS domain-containing protein|nr:hypothetical protein [Rickettsiales bacterium]
MLVRDVMSREPFYCQPTDTLQEVAQEMHKHHTGVMPLGDGTKLKGMVTDRDIAVRAVAEGMGPKTKAQDIMTKEVLYCFQDDGVEEVLENMKQQEVQRLVVLNNEEEKSLVGVVTVSDIAAHCSSQEERDKVVECIKPYGHVDEHPAKHPPH